MTQETKIERYIRLAVRIVDSEDVECGNSCTDNSKFTSQERRDIGNVLAENMTPWEFSCEVQGVGDVTYSIVEGYTGLKSIELALVYVATDGCKTVDEWIQENGLPFPDRDEMIEHLVSNIDEEEYINNNYTELLDMLPDQCVYNLSDSELIYLFEMYTDEPEIGDEVICDAAGRFGCVGDDCYHARPHEITGACADPDCYRYGVKVRCIPVEVR